MNRLADLADSALDATVVLGYTNVGYALRHGRWAGRGQDWSMAGRTALVTGASSGLGKATAAALAGLGARVVMLARDPERGAGARDDVIEVAPSSDVVLELADLSSMASVRGLAQRLREREPRLDVLVNNAGSLLNERRRSEEGLELTFATNVLGPFLLTELLSELLVQSAPARIVNVSSGGMYTQRLRVADLQSEHGDYDGPTAYARCKRAQVVLTEQWARRFGGTGVVANSMHPGWADTPGVRDSLPRFYSLTRPFLRTPEQGADTIVWLAAAPETAKVSGLFWMDRRPRPTHRLPRTRESEEERRLLWEECERLAMPERSPVTRSPAR